MPTIREWLKAHPEAVVADNMVGEGYGDGWCQLEDVLDEEIRNVYYNPETHEAEIYI